LSHNTSVQFTLVSDETTDIAAVKQLVLYVRYLTPSGRPTSMNLPIFNPKDGTVETIAAAIVTYLASNNISTSRLVALAADGASVMTGHRAGVAYRFRHLNPHVISVHCTAHRLNLDVSQDSNSIDYFGNI
jgi:hypothetical protein